jgi:hypothetical protein
VEGKKKWGRGKKKRGKKTKKGKRKKKKKKSDYGIAKEGEKALIVF